MERQKKKKLMKQINIKTCIQVIKGKGALAAALSQSAITLQVDSMVLAVASCNCI